jgi:segregation and condensation protein A
LVVAAKLILIKSRALLPQSPVPVEDEEDVGIDLVRQLEEYRRFKDAAKTLLQREEEGMRSHVRTTPVVLQPHTLTPGEVSLGDLLAALQRVLAVTPTVPINTVVSPVVISIDDKIRAIASAITGGRRVHFSGLLLRARSRVEVVVTFLAVLEMMKQGQIVAEQDEAFGEIYIVARPPREEEPSAPEPETA